MYSEIIKSNEYKSSFNLTTHMFHLLDKYNIFSIRTQSESHTNHTLLSFKMKNNFILLLISCIFRLTITDNTTLNICLDENNCVTVSSQCEPDGAGLYCPVSLCAKDRECQNGGVCIYHTCYCSNNFYGTNCEFTPPDPTNPTVNPTGFFGLSVGYPLYLSLAIPSAGVSAFIVCHLCFICCIPAMVMCRRSGRRKSQKKNSGLTSNHFIENETQSNSSRVRLHPVSKLETRHVSTLHNYAEMSAVTQFSNIPPVNSFPIPQNVSEGPQADRPLPPPPPARPEMNKWNLPPRHAQTVVSVESESGQYSYPTMRDFNVISNGFTIPRSKENGDRTPAQVAGSRDSGYARMEPKYVIQDH